MTTPIQNQSMPIMPPSPQSTTTLDLINGVDLSIHAHQSQTVSIKFIEIVGSTRVQLNHDQIQFLPRPFEGKIIIQGDRFTLNNLEVSGLKHEAHVVIQNNRGQIMEEFVIKPPVVSASSLNETRLEPTLTDRVKNSKVLVYPFGSKTQAGLQARFRF